MYYMIEIPEDRLQEVSKAIRGMGIGTKPLVPYAVGEYGNAANLDFIGDYYHEKVQEEYPDVLPWGNLSENTQLEFGSILIGTIGYMFPGFTFEGVIPGDMFEALLGRDPKGEHDDMPLPAI